MTSLRLAWSTRDLIKNKNKPLSRAWKGESVRGIQVIINITGFQSRAHFPVNWEAWETAPQLPQQLAQAAWLCSSSHLSQQNPNVMCQAWNNHPKLLCCFSAVVGDIAHWVWGYREFECDFPFISFCFRQALGLILNFVICRNLENAWLSSEDQVN